MKNKLTYGTFAVAKLTIIVVILTFNFNSAYATGPLELHFKAGLSTPNDKISKVYSDESLNGNDISSGDFFTENAELGYHLGVNARISLSEFFQFIGGVEFHRFPNSEFKIIDPRDQKVYRFKSTQNIIPVFAGIDFNFINTELLDIYATGGFAYNYISNSIDLLTEETDFSVPLDMSPTDSRIGYFLGAGTDFNLGLLKLNLELKYHHINLIGKDRGEPDKKFLAVSLGVVI
jgi:opacity protein-like surface antigen